MKRIFDIVLSVFAISILFAPMIIIGILVRITSTGPALYWSKRIGKNNVEFEMPKFRTMKIDSPEVATNLLVDSDMYLTPIGGFLRKKSLDEFPQLYSILRGNMSLVGPRPALHNQNDLISLRIEKGIDQLKPGLTGWAQINGRDELSIQDKVELEAYYMKKKSFLFDIKIIWITFHKVIFSANVSH
jgi:O-antigen biosynthesis protein WbqP